MRVLDEWKRSGPNVTHLKPGDYVVAAVRRPGRSIYDQIGLYDLTTDETYYERGINLLHGYLAEYYVDDIEYIIPVPPVAQGGGGVAGAEQGDAEGWAQAIEIQRRLKLWQPRRAAVLGTGTIGLLATLILRLRGLEGTALDRALGGADKFAVSSKEENECLSLNCPSSFFKTQPA